MGLDVLKKLDSIKIFDYFCSSNKQFTAMKEIFEGIAYFFEEVLFVPLNFLRELELTNWWAANTVTWIAIAVLVVALSYWMKQLRIFDANGEEDKSQTAHSFLGKNQQ